MQERADDPGSLRERIAPKPSNRFVELFLAIALIAVGAAAPGWTLAQPPAMADSPPPVVPTHEPTFSARPAAEAEGAFMQQNAAIMERMMAAMHVQSSGDVDTDFVTLMEPHHQAAIDMAMLQLRYGTNPQLRRIAQEIIVGQQQEIVAMRLAIGRSLPAPAPALPAAQHQQPQGR